MFRIIKDDKVLFESPSIVELLDWIDIHADGNYKPEIVAHPNEVMIDYE